MILPEQGSIVIIDDRPDEALPIIQALSKRGVAATYYQGFDKSKLPDTPLKGIRMVILDLQLFEGINDPHILSNNLIQVLKQIISENNGPYILLLWSKKQNLYESELKKNILNPTHKIVPALIVSLPKLSCLEQDNSLQNEEQQVNDIINELEGGFSQDDLLIIKNAIIRHGRLNNDIKSVAKPNAIQVIENAIKTELEKAGVFHLFVIWENMIKLSAGNIVNEVAELIPMDGKWESNMKNILSRMGVARVGQNEVKNEVLIKEAINTLNESFIDSLEMAIKQFQLPSYISIEGDNLIATEINKIHYELKKDSDGESLWKNGERLMKATSREGLSKSIEKDKKISDEDKKHSIALIKQYKSLPVFLNSRLHVELNPTQDLIPGNIYMIENISEEKRLQYLNTYFTKIEGEIKKYSLIELEVSPICDYAQNKWKRSRVLPGVIFPVQAEKNLKSKSGNNFYDIEPEFIINEVLCKIRFDYHLFNALDKQNNHKRKVMYRLKREVLLDIIAQLSSHVNRPGISFMQ